MQPRSPSGLLTRRFLVTGRVQGVGFRAATRRRALELGLEGFARNLADGRVDVQVSGAEPEVAAMQRWLQRGPCAARVDGVEEIEAMDVREGGFRVA